MSVSTCLKSLSKRKSTNSLLSAEDGRVVITFVFFEVEVRNSSTVGNQLIHVIDCVGLNNSAERSHFSISTRMPDDTLDITLAAADRKEINLGGRGLELHGVSLDYLCIIGHQATLCAASVPLCGVAHCFLNFDTL